ncbi:hypothetical protein [Pedobacter rhizosphaerae]|uniref:Uncharacterized protein n=1 Tax=Pedobacter rhizosphaerae TaxID=390241 RepID=A0A1H9S863_9SPHI|nr:hypothetical protein [Pedobacter rhizosphaerae]SER81187.1 hypothetical protein SAMN04488023_11713 [Pedobacter rhizosphaerae]
MLYFKNVLFPVGVKQPQVESALRKYALKKTSPLDFQSTTINIGTDKVFMGFERKTDLQFSRIKTSFVFMLPKLIISLPLDQSATAYRIRLGGIPLIISLFLAFCILVIIKSVFNGRTETAFSIFILAFSIAFYFLVRFELKLTQSRVLKCLEKAVN